MNYSAPAPGFSNDVLDSQKSFRTIMNALAHPAQVHPFAALAPASGPLNNTALAILLTLADYDSPVWLDPALAADSRIRELIAFHCGAPITVNHCEASFCFVSDPRSMPLLRSFAQGTPEYPDRSATIIIQAEPTAGGSWRFSGPGLQSPVAFEFSPAPGGFAEQWQVNRARFPLGVDILVAGTSVVAGLPRSLDLFVA